MNTAEKILRSPYGRPWYRMITGKSVPEELHCSIYECLVIDKGIIEACAADIQHDLYAYEFLIKGMQLQPSDGSCNLNVLSSPLREKIMNESNNLGRNINESVYSIINDICLSSKMNFSSQELKEITERHVSLFFQDGSGIIKRRLLNLRIKQCALIAAVLISRLGIGSVISSGNFNVQRYKILKHPPSFFKERPSLLSQIEEFYKGINIDSEYNDDTLGEKDYILHCKKEVSTDPSIIFEKLGMGRDLPNAKTGRRSRDFRTNVVLFGEMKRLPLTEYLSSSFQQYIVSDENKERAAKLFKGRSPLMPRIVDCSQVSQDIDFKEDRNSMDESFLNLSPVRDMHFSQSPPNNVDNISELGSLRKRRVRQEESPSQCSTFKRQKSN